MYKDVWKKAAALFLCACMAGTSVDLTAFTVHAQEQTATEESSEITPAPTAEEVQEQPEYSEVSEKEAEEFEYVDPGELVLGDHTQAEIDEALDNLASLGL